MTNSNNYTYASGVVANQVNYNFPAISGALGGITLSGMMGTPWVGDEVEEKVLEPVMSATPDYGDEDCAHDFLVYDPDTHGHQYWCKICDKRFAQHPVRVKEALERAANTAVAVQDMKETMNSFREGAMTFTKAAEKTRFSVEEFSKAMKDMREDMMRRTEYELAIELYKAGAIRPKGIGFLDLGEPF